MRNNRVFITNETYTIENGEGHARDFTPALEYGELEVLIPAGGSMISSVPTTRTMREKLKNFSDDDYLILVGDPMIIGMATTIAAEFNHGRVKLLRWDKKMRRYTMIQCDATGKAV